MDRNETAPPGFFWPINSWEDDSSGVENQGGREEEPIYRGVDCEHPAQSKYTIDRHEDWKAQGQGATPSRLTRTLRQSRHFGCQSLAHAGEVKRTSEAPASRAWPWHLPAGRNQRKSQRVRWRSTIRSSWLAERGLHERGACGQVGLSW